MLHEKVFLKALQTDSQIKALGLTSISFFSAAKHTANPFCTLQSITNTGAREIRALRPTLQLDVFADNAYEATELAEMICGILNFQTFTFEGLYFSGVRAARSFCLEVEDGTFKVPIEITYHCQEVI